MVYLRLFIGDLNNSFVELDEISGQYKTSSGKLFRQVKVMGVCTRATANAKQMLLEIDDGTGTITIQSSVNGGHLVASSATNGVKVGQLVDCIGELHHTHFQKSSNKLVQSARRWILANCVHVIDDANTETLRMLQVIELYKKSYSSSNIHEKKLTLAHLPAINSQNAMIEGKRSYGGEPLQFQNRVGEIDRTSENKIKGTTVSYNLTVPEDDMVLMIKGDLSLIVRLNRPPFAIIAAGDTIIVNNQITGNIKAVRKYTELQTILQVENIQLLCSSQKCSAQDVWQKIRSFITKAEEESYGLVVLEIQIKTSQHSKKEDTTTPSPLTASSVTDFLIAHAYKYPTGIPLTDLEASFSASSASELMQVLADLQMDGIIYAVQDKYLLL